MLHSFLVRRVRTHGPAPCNLLCSWIATRRTVCTWLGNSQQRTQNQSNTRNIADKTQRHHRAAANAHGSFWATSKPAGSHTDASDSISIHVQYFLHSLRNLVGVGVFRTLSPDMQFVRTIWLSSGSMGRLVFLSRCLQLGRVVSNGRVHVFKTALTSWHRLHCGDSQTP